jgi:enoyl-CoA hydratase/carnithine racemase
VIGCRVIDETAVITIGDGVRGNLLTIDRLAELHALADRFAGEDHIRALIITGSGERYFVAGADLDELRRLDEGDALLFARLGQSLFVKLERLPQIVIAAVNGYCMGGGLDLLLACDIRFAMPTARFAHPGSRIGIITGFGGTVRLAEEVGEGRARELLVSGRDIDAAEARDIGLLNHVVERESLMDRAMAAAKALSSMSTDYLRAVKRGACSNASPVL